MVTELRLRTHLRKDGTAHFEAPTPAQTHSARFASEYLTLYLQERRFRCSTFHKKNNNLCYIVGYDAPTTERNNEIMEEGITNFKNQPPYLPFSDIRIQPYVVL